MNRSAGQASVEYVAIVALVALILGGAATVVAAPSIPRSIVHTIRKGICIVGGDICDSADAKARGLDPCVLTSRQALRQSTATLSIIRAGHGDRLLVERLSNGRARVSYIPKGSLGASLEAALKVGKHVGVGGGLSLAAEFGIGKAWEVPQSELPHFVARVKRSADEHTPWGKLGTPEADVHFQEGGLPAELTGELEARGLSVATGEIATRRALGHRTGPDGTTWYYEGDATLAGALAKDVIGFGVGRNVLLEWRPGRTLTLRTTSGTGRVTETVSRVPAADPVARRLIAGWMVSQNLGAMAPMAAGALARLVRDHGVTERFTFDETETTEDSGFSVKRAVYGAGYERATTVTTRKLVDAEVITPEGTLKREDCLGAG
jgi:hypothetical protein